MWYSIVHESPGLMALSPDPPADLVALFLGVRDLHPRFS